MCGAGVASTRCCSSSASGSFCAAAVSAAETAWRSRTRRALSAALRHRARPAGDVAVKEAPCVESSRTCERIRCTESSRRCSQSNTSLSTCTCCSLIAGGEIGGEIGGEKASPWRLTNAFTFASARAHRVARAGWARRRGKVASLARPYSPALSKPNACASTHTTSTEVPRRSRCALVRLGMTETPWPSALAIRGE